MNKLHQNKHFNSRFLPVSNDFLLMLCVGGLFICTYWEIRYQLDQRKNKRKISPKSSQNTKDNTLSSYSTSRPLLSAPNHYGCKSLQICHMDPIAMSMYAPLNVYISSTGSSSSYASARQTRHSVDNKAQAASAQPPSPSSSEDASSSVSGAAAEPPPGGARNAKDSAALADLSSKMNILPGCEPGSPAVQELQQIYPSLSTVDAVRFLVARKGVVQNAAEMIEKERTWHDQHFPVAREEVKTAIETRCFFPFGRARDGSPVVYMRGGLYDNTVATPQQYVLAAAHTIEYALKQYPDQVNVTVVVHSSAVPGVKNATGADTNFIKLFVQVLSDNYPERLRKLVIFPFPWYGRAIWGVVKVFVDKRTQEKILLLSSSGTGIPSELSEIVDPKNIPECCGGQSKEAIVELMDTLEDVVSTVQNTGTSTNTEQSSDCDMPPRNSASN